MWCLFFYPALVLALSLLMRAPALSLLQSAGPGCGVVAAWTFLSGAACGLLPLLGRKGAGRPQAAHVRLALALLFAYLAYFAAVRAMGGRQTADQETIPMILGAMLALSLAPKGSARTWQFLGMGLSCAAAAVVLWLYGLQARGFHSAPPPAVWSSLWRLPIALLLLSGGLSALHVPLRGRAAPVLLAAAPLLLFTLLSIAAHALGGSSGGMDGRWIKWVIAAPRHAIATVNAAFFLTGAYGVLAVRHLRRARRRGPAA